MSTGRSLAALATIMLAAAPAAIPQADQRPSVVRTEAPDSAAIASMARDLEIQTKSAGRGECHDPVARPERAAAASRDSEQVSGSPRGSR